MFSHFSSYTSDDIVTRVGGVLRSFLYLHLTSVKTTVDFWHKEIGVIFDLAIWAPTSLSPGAPHLEVIQAGACAHRCGLLWPQTCKAKWGVQLSSGMLKLIDFRSTPSFGIDGGLPCSRLF